MIRLATVGTSSITESFLAACALDPRVLHSAVYSRTRDTGDAFALKTGCGRVFTDLEELARDPDVDAVYIASPNFFHCSQSKIFLENGKHVLCEKPIAVSRDEYISLCNIAQKNGVIYMEAIPPIYADTREDLKKALAQIGKISLARIDYCQRSARYDLVLAGEIPNIFNPRLFGGALMDLGVYCVSGAVDLFGVPKNISAIASLISTGADGSGCALFDYGDFPCALSYSKTGQSMIGTEIIGNSGTLKIGMISQYCNISIEKNGKETIICGKADRPHLMLGEVRRFIDYIENPEMLSEYKTISKHTESVLFCMDEIKKIAGLRYC